jgi:hypothetical protein
MWTKLIGNIAGYLVAVVIGVVAGIGMQQKLFAPEIPQCPACICPEPTVSVQPFDVDKIRGIKEFNYAPQFSGSISVAGVDSTALRKMFDKSIEAAFIKHSSKRKR